MSAEELSAEGPWELVERSREERTLFQWLQKDRHSFIIWEI